MSQARQVHAHVLVMLSMFVCLNLPLVSFPECFFFESSGKFPTVISSRPFFFFLYFPFGISTYSSLLVVVIVSISYSFFDPSYSSRSFLLQHVICFVKIIKFLKLCCSFEKLITKLIGAYIPGLRLDSFP